MWLALQYIIYHFTPFTAPWSTGMLSMDNFTLGLKQWGIMHNS